MILSFVTRCRFDINHLPENNALQGTIPTQFGLLKRLEFLLLGTFCSGFVLLHVFNFSRPAQTAPRPPLAENPFDRIITHHIDVLLGIGARMQMTINSRVSFPRN
jgi:hypothetical protein